MNTRVLIIVSVTALLLPFSSLEAAMSLGSASVTRVAPRIFTPNGDGSNDKARFEIDNPEQLPVSGEIYDLNGTRVTSIPDGTDVLLWDGTDDGGQKVAGGIYIYQLEFQGKTATGTLSVAR